MGAAGFDSLLEGDPQDAPQSSFFEDIFVGDSSSRLAPQSSAMLEVCTTLLAPSFLGLEADAPTSLLTLGLSPPPCGGVASTAVLASGLKIGARTVSVDGESVGRKEPLEPFDVGSAATDGVDKLTSDPPAGETRDGSTAGFGVLTAPMRLGVLFVGLLIDASKSAHALLIPLPTPSGVFVAGATGVNGFKGFGVAFGAAIGADDGTGGLAAGSDGTGLVACSSVRFGTLGKLKEDGIVAGCADCAEPAQWPSTVSWEAGPVGNVAFFAPRPDLRKACFGLGITLSPGGGATP